MFVLVWKMLYIGKGELAKSNAQFVKRIVELAKILGREIATPDEAREMLGLKSKESYTSLIG